MKEEVDITNPNTCSPEHWPSPPAEWRTAELYGGLWPRYSDELFWDSVDLFAKRWLANGENPDFFKGKQCLDIGCGGGRYSFAMALMGADEVVGIDISRTGLTDARKRGQSRRLSGVRFIHASALDLPFLDNEFDFICCSGVLHHTLNIEKGLGEIYRVLKAGGSAYLLLYGSGGLFWPLNSVLRPLAALVGEEVLGGTMDDIKFAPNKRRSFLDDMFVPCLETYSLQRVEHLLKDAGFTSWRKWNCAQLDHERDTEALIAELEDRNRLWQRSAVHSSDPAKTAIQLHCAHICREVIATARYLDEQFHAGRITQEQLRDAVIGEGHHRLIVDRG